MCVTSTFNYLLRISISSFVSMLLFGDDDDDVDGDVEVW